MKWILRYLWSSTNIKLCFGSNEAKLIIYSDSDLIKDIDDRKFISDYLFTHSGEQWYGNAGCKSI
jgi:hypothetical protein